MTIYDGDMAIYAKLQATIGQDGRYTAAGDNAIDST